VKRLIAIVSMLFLTAAQEPVLVPDVSQREVEIAYSFTGAELLLFGAIIYPGGLVPDGRTDIAVVLKGPPQSILVREKRKLAGLIWANADSARFRSAPTFYAIASSRPLDKLVDERTAAIYELGLGNICRLRAAAIQRRRSVSKPALSIFARADSCLWIVPVPSKLPATFSIGRGFAFRRAYPWGATQLKHS
jgi:uncharacterized protein (TIGR02186 family)